MKEFVKDKIKKMPKSPGVYMFKEQSGTIIYVGKAKNIYNRLKSYIQYESGTDARLKSLLKNINDIELILTNNEVEALLLESTLIKKHKPRYNILLKDDKTYPYLKITINEKWPSLIVTRKIANDDALYFGPYTNLRSLRFTVQSLNRIFLLRKCNENVFKAAKKPCLNYQMNRCSAPCQNKIKHKNYMGIVNAVLKILYGNISDVVKELEKEMLFASDNLEFEEATRIRDAVKALNILSNQQAVILPGDSRDIDLISLGGNTNISIVNVLYIRNGRLNGQNNFVFSGVGDQKDYLKRFIVEYYKKNKVPDIIDLPFEIDDNAISDFLISRSGINKIKIQINQEKILDDLRLLGLKNINDYIQKIELESDNWSILSSKISLAFNINSTFLIECYDMSHISGKFEVGAKIAFQNGLFNKSLYRKYKIKGSYGGDDPAMIREIISRRFSGKDINIIPEIILIDGGKTQLKAAYDIASKLGFVSIKFISLAKDKTSSKGLSDDKIYCIDNKNNISRILVEKQILNFLKKLRDEAHRFVVSYHRKLRDKISI